MPRVLGKVDNAGQLIDAAGKIIAKVRDLGKGTGSHNMKVGQPNAGDHLLYKEQIRKSYTATFATHDFEYHGDKVITAVFALDNWSDDTGGDAEMVKGGIGQNYVTVRVTSQRLRGFDFTVYVFGK